MTSVLAFFVEHNNYLPDELVTAGWPKFLITLSRHSKPISCMYSYLWPFILSEIFIRYMYVYI